MFKKAKTKWRESKPWPCIWPLGYYIMFIFGKFKRTQKRLTEGFERGVGCFPTRLRILVIIPSHQRGKPFHLSAQSQQTVRTGRTDTKDQRKPPPSVNDPYFLEDKKTHR